MKKISCIIPAFNEERHIAAVLDAVIQAKQKISMEIIVVDDGSTDNTPTILSNYKGIRVITNKPNKGKSHSVAKGLEIAKGDYILMLDSDLIGLTTENIFALLSPIQTGVAEVAMSIRRNSFMFMGMISVDILTGERVFPRALIAHHIDDIKKLPNFALEVFLNNLVIKHEYTIKTIYWSNVSHMIKLKKGGVLSGISADSKGFYDILKVMPATGLVRQNIALKKLLIKNSSD